MGDLFNSTPVWPCGQRGQGYREGGAWMTFDVPPFNFIFHKWPIFLCQLVFRQPFFLRLVSSWEAVCARRRKKHLEANQDSLGFLVTTYRLGTGVLLLLVPACIRWVVMVSQPGRRARIWFFIIGSWLFPVSCYRDLCLLFLEVPRLDCLVSSPGSSLLVLYSDSKTIYHGVSSQYPCLAGLRPGLAM